MSQVVPTKEIPDQVDGNAASSGTSGRAVSLATTSSRLKDFYAGSRKVREFFRNSATEFTNAQKAELERQLLERLTQKALGWAFTLFLASVAVLLFGTQRQNPFYEWYTTRNWLVIMWLIITGYIILLVKVINLPRPATTMDIRAARFIGYSWIVVAAAWWLIGALTLEPPLRLLPGSGPRPFKLDELTFVFVTLIGQVITVMFLAPSRVATFIAVVFGYLLPFWLFISWDLPYRQPTYWITLQVLVILLVGWSFGTDHRRVYGRGVCAETNLAIAKSDRVRAEAERARAEQEQAKAESERVRAEEERARAQKEQAKAESERARAEKEQAKAESERVRAEEERARAQKEQAKAESERARAEEERARAEKEQAKAESERARTEEERARADHFIRAISHDLKHPVTVIALTVRPLLKKITDPTALDQLRLIQQQNATIETMVNGTLDLARIASGTVKVDIRPVALNLVIDELLPALQADAADRNIHLEVRNLDYLVSTDPVVLGQRILRNLIENAIRYTDQSQTHRPGHVLVNCELQGDMVRISVEDNGIGIPHDKLDKIFKAYVQVDNPERDGVKGFGLGLAIVEGFAGALSHKISVESELGVGSCFSLFVPAIAPIPKELLTSKERYDDASDLRGMVVVVVEDNPHTRKALCGPLSEWGCDVIAGDSDDDVLAKITSANRRVRPDFIIADYRLRDIKTRTGVDHIVKLRESLGRPDLPAAIWTTETNPAKLQEIDGAGFPILAKSSDLEPLWNLLMLHRASVDKTGAAEDSADGYVPGNCGSGGLAFGVFGEKT